MLLLYLRILYSVSNELISLKVRSSNVAQENKGNEWSEQTTGKVGQIIGSGLR